MLEPPPVRICWQAADGGEHEEEWPSLDAFRCWAAAEDLQARWTAYVQDEDGDWLPHARGVCP